MPRYDYRCDACGVFERLAGRDDGYVPCVCGRTARRQPFSGAPYLKGETVVSTIPDPAYKFDAEARAHRESWGGIERVYDGLHKNQIVDEKTGQKSIDVKAMNAI